MDPNKLPVCGRYGKQETVPDVAGDANGSIDLPAPAPWHFSLTCVSTSFSQAFTSQSSTHKSRARTTGAQRVGVITSKKKRAGSRGSEREKSRSKEDSLQRRDARLANENISLRHQLEMAANANQTLYQQASVHVNSLSMTEQAVVLRKKNKAVHPVNLRGILQNEKK